MAMRRLIVLGYFVLLLILGVFTGAVLAALFFLVLIVVLGTFTCFHTLSESRTVDVAVLKELYILLLGKYALDIIEISLTLVLTEFLRGLDVLGLLPVFLIAELLKLCLLVSSQIEFCKGIEHTRVSFLLHGAGFVLLA